MPTIYTIGHSTRPIAEFVSLLRQVAVDLLVDVRSIPRSRTNPQFNSDTLAVTLVDSGISYRHLAALGVCGIGKGEQRRRLIRFGGSLHSETMPITRRLTRSEWDRVNFEPSLVTIAARLCAPRLSGGAVTAASSQTICWQKEFR